MPPPSYSLLMTHLLLPKWLITPPVSKANVVEGDSKFSVSKSTCCAKAGAIAETSKKKARMGLIKKNLKNSKKRPIVGRRKSKKSYLRFRMKHLVPSIVLVIAAFTLFAQADKSQFLYTSDGKLIGNKKELVKECANEMDDDGMS